MLTVGGQPLTQGAVVDASALSGLTFQSLPTPGVSTASFTFLPAFADGTSAGKETTVTLYLLDEANDPAYCPEHGAVHLSEHCRHRLF